MSISLLSPAQISVLSTTVIHGLSTTDIQGLSATQVAAINVTDINAAQKHEQHYGIEHIAVNTDDYVGTLDALRKQGVRILEELPREVGRRVCFVEAPDGAQMEVIERV